MLRIGIRPPGSLLIHDPSVRGTVVANSARPVRFNRFRDAGRGRLCGSGNEYRRDRKSGRVCISNRPQLWPAEFDTQCQSLEDNVLFMSSECDSGRVGGAGIVVVNVILGAGHS